MTKPTYLIGSDGSVDEYGPEDTLAAQGALALGSVAASPDQIDAYKKEQAFHAKYGTAGQQVATVAEKAGEAATFGLSTIAERAAGVSAEDIRAREKENPGSAMLGTGIGVVAPALLTGGASAAAEGGALAAARGAAELSAPSLIAKAGRAAEGLVGRILPGGEGLASKAIAGAAKMGAGSAVEGAFYGAGHVVSEAALGDPDLTAQSAMSEIGLSALMGGGIGAGGSFATSALKAITPKDLGSKLAEWAGDFEGQRNIKAAGGIQSDIARLTKQKGEAGLIKLGQEMGDEGLVGPLSTPASTLQKSKELMDEAGGKMGDTLKMADAKMTSETAPKIKDVIDKAIKEVWEPLENNPLQKGTADRLAGILDGYQQKFEAGMNASDLHDIQKQLQKEIYGLKGVKDPSATSLGDALHDFRTIVSDKIENTIDGLGLDSASWKTAKRQYEVAVTASKLAEKGIQRASGNNLVSLTELMSGGVGHIAGGPLMGLGMGAGAHALRMHASGTLGWAAGGLRRAIDSGALEGIANKTSEAISAERRSGADSIASAATSSRESVSAMASLERMNNAVSSKIDSGVSMLVNAGVRASRVGRGEIAAGLARSHGKSQEGAETSYKRRVEEVQRFTDPVQMDDALTKSTDGLHEHAPNIASSMQIAMARGMSFMASKVPAHDKAGPLGADWKPGKEEIAKFNRYYDAIQKPTSILKQAAAGTLTHEAVEGVSTVHPQLFRQMQSSLIEKMAGKKSVPYQSRMAMGMILGQTMDGSTLPQHVMSNQVVYQSPSAKSGQDKTQASVRPTQKGLGSVHLASRMQTNGQALADRRNKT